MPEESVDLPEQSAKFPEEPAEFSEQSGELPEQAAEFPDDAVAWKTALLFLPKLVYNAETLQGGLKNTLAEDK